MSQNEKIARTLTRRAVRAAITGFRHEICKLTTSSLLSSLRKFPVVAQRTQKKCIIMRAEIKLFAHVLLKYLNI